MKEIIFRIENRHLLKLGWQECIGQALEAGGWLPGHIPKGAKLVHRPIPNKAQTVFHIFVVPDGEADPVVEAPGKIRDFYEYMQQGATPLPPIEVSDIKALQREAMIQQCIAESQAGKIIH